jgi:glycosyltransferase involved in cell wall biosynthesis
MVDLYAGALAVVYAPFDEDYGYVTIEAFKSGKPVITARDSGGPLEFVEDGRNGYVCPPDAPREMAARIDALYRDKERARALGKMGMEKVAGINWDEVCARLLGEGVS